MSDAPTTHDSSPAAVSAVDAKDTRRLWIVTAVLLVALAVVAFGLGGAPTEHARMEVSLEEAGALDDEALATTVVYSEPFRLDAPRTISIDTYVVEARDGTVSDTVSDSASDSASDTVSDSVSYHPPEAASGTLLVSLVDLDTDHTRELDLEAGDTGRFARAPAGRYVVRLTGRGGAHVLGVVRSGGISWPLTVLAALLLVAPVLWRSVRLPRVRRP